MEKQPAKATGQQDTNAALAALAAAGNSFALGQLWEINKGLLHRCFWQWYDRNKAVADEHGITLEDFDRVLKCGADKVSVNAGAIRNPGLIPAAAQKYGNQCVVLSADIKRVDGKFMLFAKGGRENTGIDALDWLEQGVKNGAVELVVNSIDTDGVKNGFDLELLDAVAARCAVPIIASGGAGKKEDFLELFRNHPAVDAGLAASIFHTKQVEINDLKRYLRENGVEMRV